MGLERNHRNEIMLSDVPRLIFRNFSGRPDKYNREGDRNFGILLDESWVADMEESGYPVKYLKPHDEEDDPAPWIKVKVNYNSQFPPTVILVTSRGRTTLDSETVDLLDTAFISHADIVLNPYYYEVNGMKGYSMYLSRAYITIEEDEFERKYGEIPDVSGEDSIQEEIDGPVFK